MDKIPKDDIITYAVYYGITQKEAERRLKRRLEVSLIRNSSKLKKWSKAVKERDDYICQKCFKSEEKMFSHHKISLLKNPDKAFHISNGITLCFICHMKVDRNFERRMMLILNETDNKDFHKEMGRYIEGERFG